MSNKVIVTKAQEKELSKYIATNSRRDLLHTHAMKIVDGSNWVSYTEFNAFSLQEMAFIVVRGFKAKHAYEVGDWVTRTSETPVWGSGKNMKQGSVFQVVYVREQSIDDNQGQLHKFENIRPSTPEEIKIEINKVRLGNKFLNIERDPGEFLQGDVGVHKNGNSVLSLANIQRHYNQGNLQGFYPAKSLIKFEGNDINE